MLGNRQQVRTAEPDVRNLEPPIRSTPQPPPDLTADDGEILAGEAATALNLGKTQVRRDQRPVHTHGSYARGAFTAGAAAARWTSAAHLQSGVTTPVIVRFSNSLPSARRKDHARSARGMSVRFEVADGPSTDTVAMNTDRFFVSDREEFGAVSRAMGSPLVLRYPRIFLLVICRHMRLARGVRMATLWPPSSYAHDEYYGINTFIWSVQEDGKSRQKAVRFRWTPALPKSHLMPRRFFHPTRATFLELDLKKQLNAPKGVCFHLEVQLGDNVPHKTLVDATRTWKEPWTPVGQLDLDTFVDAEDDVAQLDALLFSPLHLCPGIEAHPDDKILAVRAAAYPASHVRRTGTAR